MDGEGEGEGVLLPDGFATHKRSCADPFNAAVPSCYPLCPLPHPPDAPTQPQVISHRAQQPLLTPLVRCSAAAPDSLAVQQQGKRFIFPEPYTLDMAFGYGDCKQKPVQERDENQ